MKKIKRGRPAKKVVTNIRMTRATKFHIDEYAKQHDLTRGVVVERAIWALINQTNTND